MTAITTSAEAEAAIAQVARADRQAQRRHCRRDGARACRQSAQGDRARTGQERARRPAFRPRRTPQGQREILAARGAGRRCRAQPPAGGVSRRAAKEHDRACDLARGVGGNRPPAFRRPRAQGRAASLWRVRAHHGRRIRNTASRWRSATCCSSLVDPAGARPRPAPPEPFERRRSSRRSHLGGTAACVGYQGLSVRSSSQRQSGENGTSSATALPIAPARCATDVSTVDHEIEHRHDGGGIGKVVEFLAELSTPCSR